MSYQSHRILHYASENYHTETEGPVFFDFTNPDTTIGFRYMVENPTLKAVFNGSETFFIDKTDSTITISHKPQFAYTESLPLLTNSIITLKKALPGIINDISIMKMISDTLISNKEFLVASFTLENKTLSSLGYYTPITLKRLFYYKVIIDPDTFLPTQILQKNSAEPDDYILTAFTNISSDISMLKQESWYYSTYLNKFKLSTPKQSKLIKANTNAPYWKGSYYHINDTLTLNSFKGKVILLEFWIKNCGYCIAAVPSLNTLSKKYNSDEFSIIGINRYDKKEDIHFFYEKNHPEFKTIIDDNGNITKAYGIDGFPTVVLIDKKGVVLYAGGFDKELIDKLLQKSFPNK